MRELERKRAPRKRITNKKAEMPRAADTTKSGEVV